MQQRFEIQWNSRIHNDMRRNPNESNKLRTFRKFKTIFKREPYIDLLSNAEVRTIQN